MAQARFLAQFALCGNVLRSAQAAAVGRRTVYDWLIVEPFKQLFDEAHEDALDQLEEEARRRAVDGVIEPVVSAGKVVTTVRKYSDNLLICLLKARRRNMNMGHVHRLAKTRDAQPAGAGRGEAARLAEARRRAD